MRRFVVILLVAFAFLLPAFIIQADELDDITKELASLNEKLEDQEADFDKLNDQLEGIKSRVAFIEQEMVKKEKEVKEGEAKLADFVRRLSGLVNEDYKNTTKTNPLFEMLSQGDLQSGLNSLFYTQSVTEKVKTEIIRIVTYIKGLEDKKAELAREKAALVPLKEEIDRQSQLLAGEISTVRSKIVELSARQQSILASRLAALNIPKSAGTSLSGCVDDRDRSPGFSPRFALFTYGVPNRTGLNQYGAKGRADAGQNADTILRAYYNFDGYQNASININVNDGNGYNTGNVIWSGSLEDYMKRIYEVPESWPMESLKAQAIAARSYAVAQTQNGSRSICANTNCQVFKTDPKGGAWDQAVNETSGQVMIQGGNTIVAYYSSTHGGIVLSTAEVPGWSPTAWTKHAVDTTTGGAGSFGDLQSNAYDRSSPWFYCDWGSRSSYNNTAWLKSEEIADIANTLLLVKRDPGTGEHLYQTDNPPSGVDNWDENRVRQELQNRGVTPFTNVSNISVGADVSGGRTTTVTVSGNKSESFNGDEWKSRFNLRAPANIQIVGPLYNAEVQ